MNLRQLALILLALFDFNFTAECSPHKHSHVSKERLQGEVDSHYEGGDHSLHTEFDHEVIKNLIFIIDVNITYYFYSKAILGSVKEAEEFDNLTPEESKAKLALLVIKMDLNADKFVDVIKVFILYFKLINFFKDTKA